MFSVLGRTIGSKHTYCQRNLSAYADGQVSLRDREWIRQHLEECEACRWELQMLRRTADLLRDLPQVRAPRSFAIPESVPAPAIPLWMRPGAYGALRAATATMAALLVIAVAGNVLALPAFGGPAWDVSFATVESVPQDDPALAEMAGVTRAVGDEAAAMPLAVPETQAAGAPAGPPEATLTAEEVARKRVAPAGKGMDAGPMATPATRAGAEGTPAPATLQVVPAPEAAQVLAAAPPADQVRETRTGWLQQVRLWAAPYPWGQWAIVATAALAMLLAATLWLRAVRARWP